MSDQRFQLYIREVLSQIQEKNKEVSEIIVSDEISRGKSEAISYKINLDNLGLRF